MTKSAKSTRAAKPVLPPEPVPAEPDAVTRPAEPVISEPLPPPPLPPPRSPVAPTPPVVVSLPQTSKPQAPNIAELFDSPIYTTYLSKIVANSAESYRIAQILSLALFGVGGFMLLVALLFAMFTNATTAAVLFGVVGAVLLVALVLYRPIERIRAATNALLRSQMAALAFSLKADSVTRGLKPTDSEGRVRAASALQEALSQFVANLNTDPSKE